jgi:hypothetical protein
VRSSLTKGGKGEKGKGGYVESGVARQVSRETYQGWKRECSSMESPGKLRDIGFGREACQSVVREHEEDSKSSLTTMPKCYHTSCRLGKS